MKCPKCNTVIPEKISYCPNCLKLNTLKSAGGSSLIPMVFAFFTFVLLFSVSFIGFMIYENDTKISQAIYKQQQPTKDTVVEDKTISLPSETNVVEKNPVSSPSETDAVDKKTVSVSPEANNEVYVESGQAFFEAPDLHTFFKDYRSAFEQAVNSGNFEVVEDFFEYRSPAYFEIRDYILDIQEEGYEFKFTENHLIDSTIQEDTAFLDTFEIFYFTNAEGITIKYERSKVYLVKLNALDNHLISTIAIKDTKRN